MSVLPRGSADRFCRGHNDVHATSPHACLAHYVRGRLRTVRLLLVTTRITITLRPNGPFDPTLGSTLLKCVWNRCAPNLQSGPRPSPPTKTAKHRVRTCVHCGTHRPQWTQPQMNSVRHLPVSDISILFRVWYSGKRKWYANLLISAQGNRWKRLPFLSQFVFFVWISWACGNSTTISLDYSGSMVVWYGIKVV